MTKIRDATILDDLENIKYNVYDTKEVISRLVQARATITLGLMSTYSQQEKQFFSKCYEIIHNTMLDIIYMDKELTN